MSSTVAPCMPRSAKISAAAVSRRCRVAARLGVIDTARIAASTGESVGDPTLARAIDPPRFGPLQQSTRLDRYKFVFDALLYSIRQCIRQARGVRRPVPPR